MSKVGRIYEVKEALALLNSMVEGGERHSFESRRTFARARDVIGAMEKRAPARKDPARRLLEELVASHNECGSPGSGEEHSYECTMVQQALAAMDEAAANTKDPATLVLADLEEAAQAYYGDKRAGQFVADLYGMWEERRKRLAREAECTHAAECDPCDKAAADAADVLEWAGKAYAALTDLNDAMLKRHPVLDPRSLEGGLHRLLKAAPAVVTRTDGPG